MVDNMDESKPPPPGRPAEVEADLVDVEHPKRPLPPVRVTTRSLDQALADLRQVEYLDAPVVSLYWDIPADLGHGKGAVSELKDLAKPVRDRAASAGLSHAARTSLLHDAARLDELEHLVPVLLGRTLAFFSCTLHGFEEAVAVGGGLGNRVEVDARPIVRPLLAVRSGSHRYAVAVVDREHAQLFEFSLGELEAKETLRGQAQRNPRHEEGDKVFHRSEELEKHHLDQTVQALQRMVHDGGADLVVIGGREDVAAALVADLPLDMRSRVAGTFAVDHDRMSPPTVRDAAQRSVDAYERHREHELVEQLVEREASGGLGALGLDRCLWAINERAVDVLLLDHDARAPGQACDRCGWLSLHGAECPVDGGSTRHVPDITDEMAVKVVDAGGRVFDVSGEPVLAEHQAGTLLRFPLAPSEPAQP